METERRRERECKARRGWVLFCSRELGVFYRVSRKVSTFFDLSCGNLIEMKKDDRKNEGKKERLDWLTKKGKLNGKDFSICKNSQKWGNREGSLVPSIAIRSTQRTVQQNRSLPNECMLCFNGRAHKHVLFPSRPSLSQLIAPSSNAGLVSPSLTPLG